MKNIDNPELLLQKYNRGICTEDEKAIVETWFLQLGRKNVNISEDQLENIHKEVWNSIFPDETKIKKVNWTLSIAVSSAAVALLISILALFFIKNEFPSNHRTDIFPGRNNAILTLPDGRVIKLNSNKSGIVSAGQNILYEDGTIASNNSFKKPNGLLTLTTPIGGEYYVVLADGTKVWLNAGTILQYPAAFKKGSRRVVRLIDGEAYFEVAKVMTKIGNGDHKQKRVPFIVESKGQQIEVLGTHFNVSAYLDEATTKTTLLEGSVVVAYIGADNKRGTVLLKPSQQSVLTDHSIKMIEVSTEDAIAWKNGEFAFRQESLASIMKKLERWYNVEVEFKDRIVSQQLFGGTISKYSNLATVLGILERTGDVKFKIEGRRVFVSK